ncbi:MAG: sucrase ferredoxin, partial [Pseudomonadota bacterium]
AGLKARPQFVRRPELDRDDVSLLVAYDGHCYRFSGAGYDFLSTLNLPALVADAELESAGERLEDPVYLVCTNGQRDLCCARFGLPVYNELKAVVGERVWQVTHLGGHRFAPNVLTLGDGCVYGRVTPEALGEFLADTEAGRVAFPFLRGRSRYSKLVQAAEAALARQNLRLLHVDADDDGGAVQFADAEERLSVTLKRSSQALRVQKSCGDPEADVYPYLPVP